jgi:hypothetical protein
MKRRIAFGSVLLVGFLVGVLWRYSIEATRAQKSTPSSSVVELRSHESRSQEPPRFVRTQGLTEYPAQGPMEGPVGIPALDLYEGHRPRYHQRNPDEWQGMRIDLELMPPCETSSQCGLARACVNGLCGPCSRSDECAQGEVCVLDHCVVSALAECRSKSNCASDTKCILSGYTPDLRGNAGLKAFCLTAGRVPDRPTPNFPPSAYASPASRAERLSQRLSKGP